MDPQESLRKWGDQKWRTSDGKPSKGKKRYLPDKAWDALTPKEKKATNQAKARGNAKGKQFVPQPKAVAKKKVHRMSSRLPLIQLGKLSIFDTILQTQHASNKEDTTGRGGMFLVKQGGKIRRITDEEMNSGRFSKLGMYSHPFREGVNIDTKFKDNIGRTRVVGVSRLSPKKIATKAAIASALIGAGAYAALRKPKERQLSSRLPLIQFGMVSIGTAKRIFRDISARRPGIKTARPAGDLMSSAFLPKGMNQEQADRYARSQLIERATPGTVVVPRSDRATKEAERKFFTTEEGMEIRRSRPMMFDPTAAALHERGHTLMKKSREAAAVRKINSRTQADPSEVLKEEIAANRRIAGLIKKHGTPAESREWNRAAQSQVLPHRRRAFYAEATQAHGGDTGSLPLSVAKDVMKRNPDTRKQQFSSHLPLIQLGWEHTEVSEIEDGRHVDVVKLIDRLKNRKVERIPISNIIGSKKDGGFSRGKKDGFSQKRYAKTDVRHPLIVDKDNVLINGRHRALKLIDSGKKHARIVRASENDLEVASLREGDEPMKHEFSSRLPLIQLASAAWQRKEGKSASGGLNRKGVASYRRENPGSKLKTAVTTPPSKLDPNSKAAKRRKSFCARMSGMQGPMKKPNGEPTRKALSLRKWNCSSAAPLIQFMRLDTAKKLMREIKASGLRIERSAAESIGNSSLVISKEGDRFIRIPTRDRGGSNMDLLAHEWGHNLDYDSGGALKKIHRSAFKKPSDLIQKAKVSMSKAYGRAMNLPGHIPTGRESQLAERKIKMDLLRYNRVNRAERAANNQARTWIQEKGTPQDAEDFSTTMTPMLGNYRQVRNRSMQHVNQEVDRLRARQLSSNLPLMQFDSQLQPHQHRVIRRIQDPNQPGLVVAHGLGSGKTRTAIEANKAIGGYADVILPAALRENYRKETARWGGPEANVMSQQALSLKGRGELKNRLLIVDEAHRARNPKSALSDAIKGSPAQKRLLLTGTPIFNNPSDIGTLVNQAAGRSVLREGKAFENRYTRPGFFSRLKGDRLSNSGELKKHLNKYVDYYKGDSSMLPTVTSQTIPVEMGKRQTELYRASMGRLPKGVKVNRENIDRLKAYFTGPRQVSNSSNALEPGSNEEPKIDRAFRDLEGHLKNPKGKALVYSNWLEHGIKPLQSRLTAAKIPHGVFTGDESMKVRNQTVKDYNEGRHRALLVSSSGAEGLDLKGTRMVQVLEPHFNNAKIRQVVGRSARMGSHDALDPEDRNVEVRSYVGRPRNRFLPGSSKGVEDLLNESARDKDEVARQITRLFSSKMNTIRFDRPNETSTARSQKRASVLLRGSAWEKNATLRAIRKSLQSKADPVFASFKGGEKEITPRVTDVGGRQRILDPSVSGAPERRRGAGVARGSGEPELIPQEKDKYPTEDFKKGGDYDTAPRAKKYQQLPPFKQGFGHYPSDWRDTEKFRAAVDPIINRRLADLKSKGAKKPQSWKKTAKEMDRVAKQGGDWEGVGKSDPISEEFQKESSKLTRNSEQLREAMIKPRQELAKELATRKEITQAYGRLYLGRPVTNWTGKTMDRGVQPRIVNEAMAKLPKLVEDRQARWKKRADWYTGALEKRVLKNIPTDGLDVAERLAKAENILAPIKSKPAPQGGFATPSESPIKSDIKQTTASALFPRETNPEKLRQKFDRVQARLGLLRSSGGEKAERIIKRRIINSGEIFEGISQRPKVVRYPANPGTKTLRTIGIGAGILGAGYLANKLLKKKDEPQKQLMASRLRLIRFGVSAKNWKLPNNPYAKRIWEKAQASGAPVTGTVDYARRELARFIKQGRKAAPRISNPGLERHERIVLRRDAERKKPDIKISHDWETRRAASEKARMYRGIVSERAGDKAAGHAAEVEIAKARMETAGVRASEKALREKQRNEYDIARESFIGETNAKKAEEIAGIRGGVRKKIAIGVGSGLAIGGAGGYAARRPEYATEFSVPGPSLKRVWSNIKEALSDLRDNSNPFATGWVAGSAAGLGVVPGSGTIGGVANVLRHKLSPTLVNQRIEKENLARLGRAIKQPLRTRSDTYQRVGGPRTVNFDEKKKSLHPSLVAGLSAGTTGALLAGIPTALKVGSKARATLKIAGIGAGLAGGLAGGSVLIGNAIKGDPKPGEQAAYTKRAALGGGIGGAIAGGAGGLLALKTAKGRSFMAKQAKNWRPVAWANRSGVAGATAIGAIGGGGYGVYQGVDEGSGVDALYGVKTKRMSSRASAIHFARGNYAARVLAEGSTVERGLGDWLSGTFKRAVAQGGGHDQKIIADVIGKIRPILKRRDAIKRELDELRVMKERGDAARQKLGKQINEADANASRGTHKAMIGVGAAGLGVIGGVYGFGKYMENRRKKAREQQLTSRALPIRFAMQTNEVFVNQGLTGKLAQDRYLKKIKDEDLDRRDANILRSAVAGAGLGAALRGTTPAKYRALIGAGAGAATAIGTRLATRQTADPYGERSREAKTIEGLPYKLAGAAAIGVAGKRGYDKLKAAKIATGKLARRVAGAGVAGLGLYAASQLFGSRHPVINLDSRRWIGGETKDGKEIKVNYARRADDLSRYYGRGTRVLKDVGGKIRGEPAVDARGRPRKNEWEKPWAKKLAEYAILGTSLVGAGKIVRGKAGFAGDSAMRGFQDRWNKGEVHSAIRKTVPKPVSDAYDKVRNFFPKTGNNATNEASGVLGRLMDRVNAAVDRKNAGTVAKAADESKVVFMPGLTPRQKQEAINEAISGIPPDAIKAARSATPDQISRAEKQANMAKEAKDKLRGLGLRSRAKLIQLDEFTEYPDQWEHWVRNRPGVIKRERRPKRWYEREENKGMINAAKLGAAIIGTAYIGRKFSPEAFAGIGKKAGAGASAVP